MDWVECVLTIKTKKCFCVKLNSFQNETKSNPACECVSVIVFVKGLMCSRLVLR